MGLKDGTTQIIQIIATTFKKLKVWKLTFSGGKDIISLRLFFDRQIQSPSRIDITFTAVFIGLK